MNNHRSSRVMTTAAPNSSLMRPRSAWLSGGPCVETAAERTCSGLEAAAGCASARWVCLQRPRVCCKHTHAQVMHVTDTRPWCCKQAELQAELAPFGLDTVLIDRYIVSSSRVCWPPRDTSCTPPALIKNRMSCRLNRASGTTGDAVAAGRGRQRPCGPRTPPGGPDGC
jgi:hypothetical protein